MDLPVVLIKFRDYVLWFGPAYLLAIGLGAASEVVLRRWLKLPLSKESSGRDAPLLYGVWWHIGGRSASACRVPLNLYIWLTVTSEALSWIALLVTAALSWPLSLLRLGAVFILASLLALLVPLLPLANKERFVLIHDSVEYVTELPPYIEWWRGVSFRFGNSSNSLLLGAALGAAIIGLAPALYSLVSILTTAPISSLIGGAIGFVLPIVPGTDAPLLAALQTRSVDNSVVFAVMLGVAASRPGSVKAIYEVYDRQFVVTFLLIAWLTSAGLAWLVSLVVVAPA